MLSGYNGAKSTNLKNRDCLQLSNTGLTLAGAQGFYMLIWFGKKVNAKKI